MTVIQYQVVTDPYESVGVPARISGVIAIGQIARRAGQFSVSSYLVIGRVVHRLSELAEFLHLRGWRTIRHRSSSGLGSRD